jgi:hypothetical protein
VIRRDVRAFLDGSGQETELAERARVLVLPYLDEGAALPAARWLIGTCPIAGRWFDRHGLDVVPFLVPSAFGASGGLTLDYGPRRFTIGFDERPSSRTLPTRLETPHVAAHAGRQGRRRARGRRIQEVRRAQDGTSARSP